LGDTLGYGLYPSAVMRQFADLGGSAGLTVLLLLANEGFALAWARRAGGWRKVSKPMIYAALVPWRDRRLWLFLRWPCTRAVR
jgi:apolipoprotein N-acyltransferase